MMPGIGLVWLALLAAPEQGPSVEDGMLPAGAVGLSAAAGARGLGGARPGADLDLTLAIGINDRLQINVLLPALVLRLGTPGATEILIGAGDWGLTYQDPPGLSYKQGAALGVRTWYGRALALALTSDAGGTIGVLVASSPTFEFSGAAGVTWAATDAVSVHVALQVNRLPYEPSGNLWISLGSAQRWGFRRVPLIAWRARPNLSVDLYAAATWPDPLTGSLTAQAMVGVTFWPADLK